jgi:hypothetical protein
MRYIVVTTFNQKGYEKYGQRMVQTFLAQWPAHVQLVVYAENCTVLESAPNLKVLDLHEASSALVRFKDQWSTVPKATGDVSDDPVRSRRKDAGKGFKWNAVRFAHKVYSIFHCAKHYACDWLIWMDADMVCHSPVTMPILDQFCPLNRDLCYLGRVGKYSECGLYAMNLNSKATRNFLIHFQQMYDDAEHGIFSLQEWHDSFVFDAVRSKHPLRTLDWSANLIKGEGHPLINSGWGAYLDHLKGDRKEQGRSKTKDLKIKRSEPYWHQTQ